MQQVKVLVLKKHLGRFFCCLLFFLLAGCSAPKRQATQETIFFPPPPNLPRVQLLMKINDSTDIEGEQSGFSLVGSLQEKSKEVRSIIKPYGVVAHGSKIYVCDAGLGQVVVIDFEAETFSYLKGNHGYGALKKPVNLAVAPDGNIYVADTGRREVLVYDAAGDYLGAFGREYGMKPVDIAADEDFLYVLDFENNEIKILERQEGKLVDSIGKKNGSQQGLAMPINLAMDQKKVLYVTNLYTGQVVKLDRDGHFLEGFGKLGDGFGQFGRPRGIDIDEQGRIYVADASHQNVQMFRNDGRLLMFFSEKDGRPLNLPAGVSVSGDNLEYFQKLADPGFALEQVVFVTAQFGSDKVYVYGLGKKEGIDYEEAYRELQAKREEMARLAREKLEREKELASKKSEK